MSTRSPGCTARSAAEMVVKWPRTVVHLPTPYHGAGPLHFAFVVGEEELDRRREGLKVRLAHVGGLFVLDERVVELAGTTDEW